MLQVFDPLSISCHTIEVVFFDLGDTLVRLRDDVWITAISILHNGIDLQGFSAPDQSQVERLKLAHQTYLRQKESVYTGRISDDDQENTIWQTYFRTLLTTFSPTTKQKLINEATDYLAAKTVDEASFECFPDVCPTLEWLTFQGVRLAIISNAYPSARRILKHLSLEKWFDCTLLSHELGIAKPSSEIYHLALASTGVSGSRALFIDDRARFLQLESGSKLPMNVALIDRGYANLENWAGITINGLDMISVNISIDEIRICYVPSNVQVTV